MPTQPARAPAKRAPSSLETWVKIAAALVAVLLFAPQPNALPLIQAVQRGLAARDSGDLPTAVAALSEAYTRQPWNAAFAYDVGRVELAAGQYEAAVQHLTLTARLSGWTPELRVLAGDAYFALADVDNALLHWQTAARDRPDDPNLRLRLADAYEASGKFSEAIDSLRYLAQANPQDAQTQMRLGRLLAVFEPQAALEPLERAAALDLALGPESSALTAAIRQGQAQADEAYLAASVGVALIRVENYPLAEAAFQRAVGFNRAYGEAYAYLGLAQDKQGKDGGPALEQAVALTPDSALAHSLLGLHYRRTGQNERALEALNHALELDPDNPDLAAEIAGAHAAQGDYETAEQWYQAATQMAPNDPGYALLLAQFYMENELKLPDAGLAAAQRAVELAPDSAAARDTLGFIYVLLGEEGGGEAQLRQALELDPALPAANYHLAVLLAAKDDREGAVQHYRRALELDPQGRYGNLALRALALLGAQ